MRSNPLQRFPQDPVNAGKTFNVNKNVKKMAQLTGWSFFDYSVYEKQQVDGRTCSFPNGPYDANAKPQATCGAPTSPPVCLTDPEPQGNGGPVLQVNVCRTDVLPPQASSCVEGGTNGQNISCLNRSVVAGFPAGLASKWKYYMLIGAQWMKPGGPAVGCFEYADGPKTKSGGTSFGNTCDKAIPGTFERKGSLALANTTMETWMQKDICLHRGATDAFDLAPQDCFSCHAPLTSTAQGGFSHIFGRVRKDKNEDSERFDK